METPFPNPIKTKFGTIIILRPRGAKFHANLSIWGLLGKWVKYKQNFYHVLYIKG